MATAMEREYRFLKRVKIPVERLRIGHYVAELDKPWRQSSFILQGFPVDDKHTLQQLQRECRFVVIEFKDEEKYRHFLLDIDLEAEESVKVDSLVSVAAELNNAFAIYNRCFRFLNQCYREIAANRPVDLSVANTLVNDFIDSLGRNPIALQLVSQIKQKIHYETQHPIRVTIMALAFSIYRKFRRGQLLELGMGCLLHEIGKAKIASQILLKEGKLTQKEALLLRQVPELSYYILRNSNFDAKVCEIAHNYHERYDGKGYPRRLPQEHVSQSAKLISVLSVYDAMTSSRIRANPIAPSQAFERLKKEKGTKFDPALCSAFMQWIGQYPIGTLLELNTGELAFVVDAGQNKNRAPKVLVVSDEQHRLTPEWLLDIEQLLPNRNRVPYQINRDLAEGSFGMQLQQHIKAEDPDGPVWSKQNSLLNFF
jgi:HD-GYP domain-containing protein (c-di-GMP phosphodiesterase class II)